MRFDTDPLELLISLPLWIDVTAVAVGAASGGLVEGAAVLRYSEMLRPGVFRGP